MSDSEYNEWWRSKQISSVCALCQTPAPVVRSHCDTHTICADCKSHEEVCNIAACSLCPAPTLELDLRCDCGLHTIQPATAPVACACGQVPVLLRHFRRRERITNYILPHELLCEKQALLDTACAIRCPCGTRIERTSACNHVTHCRHSICAECGAIAFPWEHGLVEHMRESGCLQWPTPETMRTFAARRTRIVDNLIAVEDNTTCTHP